MNESMLAEKTSARGIHHVIGERHRKVRAMGEGEGLNEGAMVDSFEGGHPPWVEKRRLIRREKRRGHGNEESGMPPTCIESAKEGGWGGTPIGRKP